MDLISFQYDRSFVLDALRQGDIDYLEHVSEAAEADLFRHFIRRQVIQRLADTYPSPRKKQEVPVAAENYRRFRQARATLVKLHQRILAHVERLEAVLQLPPPKPAARRRKR